MAATAVSRPTGTDSATPARLNQRAILHKISWETYAHLLADTDGQPLPQFTSMDGVPEDGATLATQHEPTETRLTVLVENVADVKEIDVLNVGSMTFRRPDRAIEREPDVAFMVQNAAAVADREQIDVTVDPPTISPSRSRSPGNRSPRYRSTPRSAFRRFGGYATMASQSHSSSRMGPTWTGAAAAPSLGSLAKP